MTTDETTPEQYTPTDDEVQELIVGLLLDAGDYVRHGQPDPDETLTWNQREVRAWRAARLLSERHAHDAHARRDAALHEKQRIAGEVRLWASISQEMGEGREASRLYAVAGDIDRIPEETS